MLILDEIRCPECGRKLMELCGQAQVKCPKCKSMIFANITDTERKVYIKSERQNSYMR
jgi:phage FluMu protein Com